jgi:hypothetical protein
MSTHIPPRVIIPNYKNSCDKTHITQMSDNYYTVEKILESDKNILSAISYMKFYS